MVTYDQFLELSGGPCKLTAFFYYLFLRSVCQYIFEKAINDCKGATIWYTNAKKSKKWWAQTIRISSILLGAIAALLPTISDMVNKGRTRTIPAGWTTICLGGAGAILLLDKFFGFSSAWMRYIIAEMQLRQMEQEFEMDWENARASWQESPPSKDEINQMLARCKAFTSQISTIIREETNVWVQEFQNTIKSLDESIKSKPAVTEPGALNLTISNEDVAKEGWEMIIDNGDAEKHKGYTAGKRNLIPGRHEVVVKAKINGKELQAGKVFLIPAGGICEEKMTLA